MNVMQHWATTSKSYSGKHQEQYNRQAEESVYSPGIRAGEVSFSYGVLRKL